MDGEEILEKLEFEKTDLKIIQSSYEHRKIESRYQRESTSSLVDNKGSSRYTNNSRLKNREENTDLNQSKLSRFIPYVKIQPTSNMSYLQRNKRKTETGVAFETMGEVPRRIETALTNDLKLKTRYKLPMVERNEPSIGDQSTVKANNNTANTAEDKDSHANENNVTVDSPSIRVTVSQLCLMRELEKKNDFNDVL